MCLFLCNVAVIYAQNQLKDVQITDLPALASQAESPVTVNLDLTRYDTITDKKVKCFIWSDDGIIPLLDEAYQKEG